MPAGYISNDIIRDISRYLQSIQTNQAAAPDPQATDKAGFSFDPYDFVGPWNITEHDERRTGCAMPGTGFNQTEQFCRALLALILIGVA